MRRLEKQSQANITKQIDKLFNSILNDIENNLDYDSGFIKESEDNKQRIEKRFESLSELIKISELTEDNLYQIEGYSKQLHNLIFGKAGTFFELRRVLKEWNYLKLERLVDLKLNLSYVLMYVVNYNSLLKIYQERSLFEVEIVSDDIIEEIRLLRNYTSRELDIREYNYLINFFNKLMKLETIK